MGEVKRDKAGLHESHLPHWYARYNQIYRKRVEYMNVARQLQHRLRVPAGDNLDCLRTKAAIGQNRRSPLVWNQKACTCHKCQTTALATYYPGILYLNSHADRGHLYPCREERRCRSEGCANSFQTVIGNSYSGAGSFDDHGEHLAPLFAQRNIENGFVFPSVTLPQPVRHPVSIPSKRRRGLLPPLPNISNLTLAPQHHVFY